jgi:hypothetical protein
VYVQKYRTCNVRQIAATLRAPHIGIAAHVPMGACAWP